MPRFPLEGIDRLVDEFTKDIAPKYGITDTTGFSKDLHNRLLTAKTEGRFEVDAPLKVYRGILDGLLAEYCGLPPSTVAMVPVQSAYTLSPIQRAFLPVYRTATFWELDALQVRAEVTALHRDLLFNHADVGEQRRAVTLENAVQPVVRKDHAQLPTQSEYLSGLRKRLFDTAIEAVCTVSLIDECSALGIEPFTMPKLPKPIPHAPEKTWFENIEIPIERKLDALVEYARRIPAQRGLDEHMTPELVSDYLLAILDAPNMKLPRTHHAFLLEEEAQISVLREWRGPNGTRLRTAYLVDMAERYREILKK